MSKAVNLKTLHEYDKFHTVKNKMMCGVEMTILYPIKETEHFYRSVEVHAYCASNFKAKKKDFKLEMNIPTITTQKTIDFLEEYAWHDWVGREMAGEDEKGEMTEAVAKLKTLFPDKEIVYFYELDNLLVAYNNGVFLSYDYRTGELKEPGETNIRRRKFYTRNYSTHIESQECRDMQLRWTSQTDEELKKQYLTEYIDFERDYHYKHNNIDDVFLELGQNAVCYPTGFSESTADWSKEKYGKLISYAHAGEINFVVTPEKVYFEIKRHY
jgi:hypothetical protein